jgi:hypothetical protein
MILKPAPFPREDTYTTLKGEQKTLVQQAPGLNSTIAGTADWGWAPVTSIDDITGTNGYCASDANRWTFRISEPGFLHPTRAGHGSIAAEITKALGIG